MAQIAVWTAKSGTPRQGPQQRLSLVGTKVALTRTPGQLHQGWGDPEESDLGLGPKETN